ncbi:MAG TPA: aminoacyl-tRNA hydrolase [Dissulfurispiraceae bacterium]|nr:aminoacyl-tRNA hydrolase [Dissulfurispiraceae bacterium]
MILIAGLGNPGEKYRRTRHNIGFRVIDRLSEIHGIALQTKPDYSIGEGALEGHCVTLLKPLTFMNLSGRAVQKILRKFLGSAEDPGDRLIVVHDDIDLPVGRIRIRRSGSSGGHRGIESIIVEIGTREFVRIKVGVGRDPLLPVEHFVLQSFRPDEREEVTASVEQAAKAVAMVVVRGLDSAMNAANRQKPGEEKP